MNKMKRLLFYVIFIISLTACDFLGYEREFFWYPIRKLHVKCLNLYEANIYLLKHSNIWRSWPYYLEIKNRQEIMLPNNCIFRVIKELPQFKNAVEKQLLPEQLDYIIKGN